MNDTKDEGNEPAMSGKKKTRLKVNPGCLMSVGILLLSAVVLFLTPIFNIDNIVIAGNEKLSKTQIMIASRVREGKNIFAINKGSAEKSIKALGYIEDVKITRKLPNEVNIYVKEGTAAAYLDFGEVYAGINSKGATLCHVSKALQPDDAPIVSGILVSDSSVGEKLLCVEENEDEYELLLKLLVSFKEHGIDKNITHVDVTRRDGIVFRYKNALKIEFGSISDYDLKFNYVKAMIYELGENPTGVINMQSENYVYRNTLE